MRYDPTRDEGFASQLRRSEIFIAPPPLPRLAPLGAASKSMRLWQSEVRIRHRSCGADHSAGFRAFRLILNPSRNVFPRSSSFGLKLDGGAAGIFHGPVRSPVTGTQIASPE
jgi:hypothetical protein